jgi:hypothetical protein
MGNATKTKNCGPGEFLFKGKCHKLEGPTISATFVKGADCTDPGKKTVIPVKITPELARAINKAIGRG